MAMTQEEHQIIIAMFRQQEVAFASLIELLKSQGIVQEGDLAAYMQAMERAGKTTLIREHVEAAYRGFCTAAGVTLETLPEVDDE